MRTWLLTTIYGSWLPGDRRGSIASVRDNGAGADVRIEHDIPGEPYDGPMPELEADSRSRMKGPPLYLDVEKAEAVLKQFQETAAYRGWKLLAVSIMFNHFHLVVEVAGDPEPGKVLGDFKAYATRILNRLYGRPPSETWWTAEGSKRKLRDEKARADGIHYVLKKQPNPSVVWEPGEPVA